MLSSRLTLRHAVSQARSPLWAALPPLARIPLHRFHHTASSDAPGPKNSPSSSMPTDPAAGAAGPASTAPKPTMRVLFQSEEGAGLEQSKELAAIQSRLDLPYSIKPGSPWGFVMFRTAYGPGTDTPWKRILALLADSMRDTCACYPNVGDLPGRHVLAPIEDAARFDGASSHTVRDASAEWAAAEMKIWAAQPDVPDIFCGTRYKFCLYFDVICLESLEHKRPQSVVKLLTKH